MQLPLTNGLEVPGLRLQGLLLSGQADHRPGSQHRGASSPCRERPRSPATRENWRPSSAAHQECCSCRSKRSDAQRRDRSHTLRVRSTASYCRASSIISAVRRRSSSRPRGTLRCVERGCPSAAQARRLETCNCARTCSMQARRRAGLEVSPSGLLQNELVQCQIRDRLAQSAVLELKILQALHLLGLQPAKLLAPPIIRHLAHPDLADCGPARRCRPNPRAW